MNITNSPIALSTPRLIIMSGLPGSGKSTIAERLAQWLRVPVFSVDPIEAGILAAGIAKSFETGLAAYLVAETLAGEQLKLGISVIVDAVNAEEEGKDMWRGLARRFAIEPVILEVVVGDEALHRSRLEARVRNLPGFREVTWEQVVARRAHWTPWKEPVLRLDSSRDLDANVSAALHYIESRQS